MCIDTIFICFCEDCEINDGQENPYFMSRGLLVTNGTIYCSLRYSYILFLCIKEFVEKSKKVLRARAGRNGRKQPNSAYDNPAMNAVDEPGAWNTGVPPPPYQFRPTAPPLSFQK